MTRGLFRRDGDLYHPNQAALGPWSPDFLHGGSPSGLLAAVMEDAMDGADLRLARFTLDLLRPVPAKPLLATVETVRAGRRLRVLQGTLSADGVVVSRATGLYLERTPVTVPAEARFDAPALPARDSRPVASLIAVAERDLEKPRLPLPGLHSTVEVALIDGVEGRGRGRAWMRLPVPVIEGAPCSTVVRAATLSDFGNGVGQLKVAGDIGTINADISLYLHRDPRGDWLGLDARSRMEDNGNGLVETTLFDEHGPVGRVLQATLAMPVYAG
ncbi:hypothetical protein A6D6_02630 [Alcanivorax xiamenensis]|uniref:Thioesterase-like superfamily protein n=1 Tax=Alcanivorax xiamenensis TaxID=1177156 RepID=A0ABQ6Y6K7_9GAMM|nr:MULTISPECIES: thioesterase family protein [Alcanivorax]KAF0804998.1 hypothetical protein A6D6_02630 [Alcanivorax xiamenensis]